MMARSEMPQRANIKPHRAILAAGVLLFALCSAAEFAHGAVPARTIAHDFLDMEKVLGAGAPHHAAVDALVSMAATIIPLRDRYSPEEALQVLRTIHGLLSDQGYRFRNNLLLFRGLERKEIDCDNYCALYIAIAESLKIPLVPVYAPNHSFLRFFFADGSSINWEPTEGRTRSDEWYVKTLGIAEVSIRQGVYLKTLERREFLAVEYNTIGAYLMTQRKFTEALAYFGAAIELYPAFASAYHNRGSSFYAVKRPDEALADLLKANELDPVRAPTHNTLGDVYFDRGMFDKALHEYAEAVRLDPGNFAPYQGIGLTMKAMGKAEQAEIWLKKAAEIRSKSGR
jgi:tetratricopeptide (TPR) repeat protein